MLRPLILLIVTLALLVGASLSAGATPIQIDTAADKIDLTEQLELLRDPDGRLQYAEVLDRYKQFRPASRLDLVTGFNAGIYWLRLSLLLPIGKETVQSEIRWLAVGTAKTQRVTLYLGAEENLRVMQSGRTIAVTSRPLDTMDPVFPIRLVPGKPVDVLLRVDTRGVTNMASFLWAPEAYRHDAAKTQMLLTAILAGLLVSGSLALIAFAAQREQQYLWLSLIMFGLAGLEATRSNFLSTYLWPEHLSLPGQVLSLFAAMAVFGLSKIASHLLDLARHMPRADRLLLLLRWTGMAGALLSLVSYGMGVRVLSIVAATQNIVVLVIFGLAWLQGQTTAPFFLLVFSLALLTETARQLANLGLLPWIAALDFSTFLFLLASPLILFGLIMQTRRLSMQLYVTEELQQAKSAFLARISHELRSPLSMILGLSRMLARQSPKLSLREGTAGIEKSVLRLLRMIEELLDETRAAAGMLTISPAPLSIKPWLEEIAHTAGIALQEKGNKFDCSFLGELSVTIEIDGERLRQVLENLINNANRHTDHGTIRFECHASRRGSELMIDFAIADDGEGIAPERQKTIFEPFVHGGSSSKRQDKGYGLGLPICRELLLQMGSHITIESTPGQGSRFTFSLCCPIVAPESPTQRLPPTPDITPPTDERPRVLLVDDDPLNLVLLSKIFEKSDWTVGTAEGGGRAIEMIQADDWDVVVTDQMMPGVNGWGVLSHIRATKPGLPIILLSAVAPLRPPELSADIQFEAVLFKTVSSEEVLAAAWYQILKFGAGATLEDWQSLTCLAREGDVSGIEDWIAECAAQNPANQRQLVWIAKLLYRLDLQLLERVAGDVAQPMIK